MSLSPKRPARSAEHLAPSTTPRSTPPPAEAGQRALVDAPRTPKQSGSRALANTPVRSPASATSRALASRTHPDYVNGAGRSGGGDQSLSSVLARKAAILAQRRFAADDHLQRRTAAELEPFIASKASGTILIYRGHLERFQRFATSNNVPLYPITADLVAIFLHEMVSLGAYKVTPILTTLNALRNNTGAIWQGSLAEDDYRGALAKYPAIVDLMAKGASETAATAANNEDEMATPPESPARSRDASSPTDIEPQLGDPNRLPRVGQRFPTVWALVEMLRASELPLYNVGIQKKFNSAMCGRGRIRFAPNTCPFIVRLRSDPEQSLEWSVMESSCFEHNHGFVPSGPQGRAKTSATQHQDHGTESMGSRLRGRDEKPSASDLSAHTSRGIKRERSPQPPLSLPPRQRAKTGQYIAEKRPLASSSIWSGPTSRTNLGAIATSSSSSTSSLAAGRPPSHTSPSLAPYAPDPSFLPHLTSFLSALHPSFTTFAPTLSTHCGLGTLDNLVSLLSMHEDTRQKLLESVVGLTPLMKVLLKAKLREVATALRAEES